MSPVISSTRGSDGLPLTVTSRNVTSSFVTHLPESSPGTLTHGVSTVLPSAHGFNCGLLVIVWPVASRYACRSAAPPASAAGLVHDPLIAGSGALPNSVLVGGSSVERNAE